MDNGNLYFVIETDTTDFHGFNPHVFTSKE